MNTKTQDIKKYERGEMTKQNMQKPDDFGQVQNHQSYVRINVGKFKRGLPR